MRFLLAALAVAILLALGWFWLSHEHAAVDAHAAFDISPAAAAPAERDDRLVEVAEPAAEPRESRTTGSAAPARPKAEDTSLCPKGFSQLVVRVVAGKRPVPDVLIEVPKGADARLDGDGDERGRGVTNAQGEVRFFVRPTRTLVISARTRDFSRTAEGTYTTPFEGRSRAVELDIGTEDDVGLALLILAEIGGASLPGASVEVIGTSNASTKAAFSSGGAVVHVRDGPDFEYRISHPGFVTETLSREALEELASDDGRGATDDDPIAIRLRPYAHVRGKLAGKFAAPIGPDNFDMDQNRALIVRTLRARQLVVLQPGRDPQAGGAGEFPFSMEFGARVGQITTTIGADGEWSMMVAIPKDSPDWEGVLLEVSGPDEATRTLATIEVLRPGDHVTVEDPWVDAASLSLAFRSATGQPLAVDKRVLLSPDSIEAARQAPAASGVINAEGRIYLPRLPVGRWHFFVEVPGAPRSWSPSGTFLHEGSPEPVVVTFPSEPLTVKLPRQKRGAPRSYRLGISEAGLSPGDLVDVSEGYRFVYPWVPPHKSWALVLIPMGARFSADSTGRRAADLEGAVEVPIHPDDREITLNPSEAQ